jgi:polysaccharide export outer membrane protein
MNTTMTANRVFCGNSGNESLRDCRNENRRCAFRVIIRGASATSLLFALILLTGCLGKSVYPDFAPPARAGVSQAETVTLTNEPDRSLLEAPTRMFTLGPGDRLELELIGDPASRTMTVVAPDGKLYFNLLPGADVWGLTLTEAKARLENGFTNYVREPPRIAMTLRGVESKRVWVLGCVQAPGVYTMATPLTLLESISMAGGTLSMTTFRDQAAAGIGEELADLKRSFVLRHGKLLPVDFNRLLIEGDLSQNIYLQPDDFVYVPAAAARDVYVLGAVIQPRPVPYMEGMTVAGAVASAYGTLKDAYLSHVAVVRGSLSQPQVTIVNYRKVIRGEESDFPLKPHDIVYVPFSPYRYLRRYVDVILQSFVTSTAINAGSHAVTKQAGYVGGVFIPVGSGIQIIPPVAPPPP